jgi:hypothetical protein
VSCPHCSAKFALQVPPSALPDNTILVCETCSGISRLESTGFRVLTPEEMAQLQASSRWYFVQQMRREHKINRMRRIAQSN